MKTESESCKELLDTKSRMLKASLSENETLKTKASMFVLYIKINNTCNIMLTNKHIIYTQFTLLPYIIIIIIIS